MHSSFSNPCLVDEGLRCGMSNVLTREELNEVLASITDCVANYNGEVNKLFVRVDEHDDALRAEVERLRKFVRFCEKCESPHSQPSSLCMGCSLDAYDKRRGLMGDD